MRPPSFAVCLLATLATGSGLAGAGQLPAARPPITPYQNPVVPDAGGDPFCLRYQGTYYLYRPVPEQQKVVVNTSADLVHWSATADMDFRPGTRIWAPEVHQIGAALYIFYAVPNPGGGAAGRDIRVCRLASPTQAGANQPVTLVGAASSAINIDPTVYQAGGTAYLVWKSRPAGTSGSDLNLQPLASADPTRLAGRPQKLLTNQQHPGNKEHPTLLSQPYDNGRRTRYFLLFSSGQGNEANYNLEYATANSLAGPFASRGVLVGQHPAQGIFGVGASSVVRDGQHYRWLVYRAKQTARPSWGDRYVCLDRLELNAVTGTVRCAATHRPQVSPFYPAFPR